LPTGACAIAGFGDGAQLKITPAGGWPAFGRNYELSTTPKGLNVINPGRSPGSGAPNYTKPRRGLITEEAEEVEEAEESGKGGEEQQPNNPEGVKRN
jgi:hypothetical protein